VSKIKRYLEKSTGVPPEKQILTYQGQLLADDMIGRDFGLVPEGVFNLAFASSWSAGGRPAHGDPTLEYDAEGRGRQRALAGNDTVGYGDVRPKPAPTGQTPPPTTSAYLTSGGQSVDDYQSRLSRMTSPRAGGGNNAPPMASSAAHTSMSYGDAPSYTPAAAFSTSRANGYDASSSSHITSMATAPHPLTTKVQTLEDENRALRAEMDRMRREAEQSATLRHSSVATPGQSVIAMARSNLHELGKELGQHLTFDDSLSCVVGADEQNTIVITVDPPTERMYLYSTLLTSLPREPSVRLRLFEAFLEWSMLGRDVAGGAIGICPRSGIAMMSTSIDLKHGSPTSLRDTAPVFIECLVRWRREAQHIVDATESLYPVGYTSGGGLNASSQQPPPPMRRPPSPPCFQV
jgi:hypothetical protein